MKNIYELKLDKDLSEYCENEPLHTILLSTGGFYTLSFLYEDGKITTVTSNEDIKPDLWEKLKVKVLTCSNFF